MILCLDCGNTSIKIGIFEGNVIKKSLSIRTDRNKSSDEYALSFSNLIKQNITGAIISSVVPLLTDTIIYWTIGIIEKIKDKNANKNR